MQNLPIAVVSVSGGKDSTATALLAIERYGRDRVVLVHADTGHEHEVTEHYIRVTLPAALGMPVHIVKADFSDDISRKRRYVADKWPEKLLRGRDGKWVLLGAWGADADDPSTLPPAAPPQPNNIYRGAVVGPWVWSPAVRPLSAEAAAKVVARALDVLHPTGIPFLDLCMQKGRFPSRKAQFCTQFLKRYPLDKFMMDLANERGLRLDQLESWQGVRRDESHNRKDVLDREQAAEGWWVERPIAGWTAQETVDFVLSHRVPLNPLYAEGCSRVGCMVCINAGKDEIANCARRWPHHIFRIRSWERFVGMASKRGLSSLLHHSDGERGTAEDAFAASNIDAMVKWAMTSRGGKQFDWLRSIAKPAACSSSYGLCE